MKTSEAVYQSFRLRVQQRRLRKARDADRLRRAAEIKESLRRAWRAERVSRASAYIRTFSSSSRL